MGMATIAQLKTHVHPGDPPFAAFEQRTGDLANNTAHLSLLPAQVVHAAATAARIALEYYDRAYEHGLQKRAKDNRHPVDAQGATLAQCAERLMAAADDMGL